MERVNWGFFVSVAGLPVLVWVLGGFSPGALIYASLSTALTGVATLVVGAPLYNWCRKRGHLSLWPFMAGGAFAGLLVLLPVLLVLGTDSLRALGSAFTVIGAIHGSVFWLVAICGNAALTIKAENMS